MQISVAGQLRPVYIEHKRMKNMYLRVNKDGSLQVTCPSYVNQEEIARFIQEKGKWIAKSEKTLQRHETEVQTGVDGKQASWLGKTYAVQIVESHKEFMFIDEEAKSIIFFLREDTPQARVRVFYKEGAKMLKNMIDERRGDWDQLICANNQKPFPKITIKYMTSRWGSCTPRKNAISMSVRLIHYPAKCLDYVLLHEYAHILVPNHSKKFYDVIEQYMPDWKDKNQPLK